MTISTQEDLDKLTKFIQDLEQKSKLKQESFDRLWGNWKQSESLVSLKDDIFYWFEVGYDLAEHHRKGKETK